MKLARTLLATAAVLALAACGDSPVSVEHRTGPESLRATVVADTTFIVDSTGDTSTTQSNDDHCWTVVVNADGTTSRVYICADGPFTGGGGG